MKKVGLKRLSASRGSASTLDTRLEKERKMMRMVVGFLRNFFSEQRTMRAMVLRMVPKIAITLQIIPPMTR